jgi:hypothetical protein
MPGISPAAPSRSVGAPFSAILTTGNAASQSVDPDIGAGPLDDSPFGRVSSGQIGIAEPSLPATPLSGGSYAAGRTFPVGGTCCDGGGNVLTTKNVVYAGARANTTVNGSGAITWSAGAQGTPVVALMRSSGWGPGDSRVPGCIGDNSEATGGSAFPDPGPCNDALGAAVQSRCTGANCATLNTGGDDPRTTRSIGGSSVPVIAARGKIGSPAGTTPGNLPTLYAVANTTLVDVDLLATQANGDFAATLEAFYCPLQGTCSTSGAACVLDSHCPMGQTCSGRARPDPTRTSTRTA